TRPSRRCRALYQVRESQSSWRRRNGGGVRFRGSALRRVFGGVLDLDLGRRVARLGGRGLGRLAATAAALLRCRRGFRLPVGGGGLCALLGRLLAVGRLARFLGGAGLDARFDGRLRTRALLLP